MIQIICFICMTNTSTWLFDTLIFDKFITHCPDMGQSLSICINYYQWASINVNKHQSSLISINQHQSASISINRHQNALISINQHQPASISINQHQSRSISISQHINRHQSPFVIDLATIYTGINVQNSWGAWGGYREILRSVRRLCEKVVRGRLQELLSELIKCGHRFPCRTHIAMP